MLAPFETGDQFSFQVYGNRRDAIFAAKLASSRAVDPELEYGPRSGDAQLLEIECAISDQIDYRDSEGPARFRVFGASADLEFADLPKFEGVPVVDISMAGFASLTERPVEKGDQAKVRFYARGQIVDLEAQVRNCVPVTTERESFRIGFQIVGINRVDAILWKRLCLSMLDTATAKSTMPIRRVA